MSDKKIEEFDLIFKVRVATYEGTNLKVNLGTMFEELVDKTKEIAKWNDASIVIDEDNSCLRIYGKGEGNEF